MTIYTQILSYLRRFKRPVAGGQIEYHCAKHKPSTVSRRLRELENAKDIIATYQTVPDCKNEVVFYKINPKLR